LGNHKFIQWKFQNGMKKAQRIKCIDFGAFWFEQHLFLLKDYLSGITKSSDAQKDGNFKETLKTST